MRTSVLLQKCSTAAGLLATPGGGRLTTVYRLHLPLDGVFYHQRADEELSPSGPTQREKESVWAVP